MNTALADMNAAPHYRIPPSRGGTAPHYRIPTFSTLSNTEHTGIILRAVQAADGIAMGWLPSLWHEAEAVHPLFELLVTADTVRDIRHKNNHRHHRH